MYGIHIIDVYYRHIGATMSIDARPPKTSVIGGIDNTYITSHITVLG